jgi:non-ribosomal peptide synthase protein (TIGR01720 family)
MLFRLDSSIEAQVVEEALGAVVEAHPAFRLRFRHKDRGWTQQLAAHSTQPVFLALEGTASVSAEEVAAGLRDRFDLAEGPLIGAAVIRRAEASELVVTINHLVVDAVSWHILVDDLGHAIDALRSGSPVPPVTATSTYADWLGALADRAASPWLAEQRGFWAAQAQQDAADLPVDSWGGRNTVESAADLTVTASTETTESLLRELPAVAGLRIHEVLLGGMALALLRRSGRNHLSVEMEGHGREVLDGEELDLSRTVGWFTSLYPLTIRLSPTARGLEAARTVREAMRAVPDGGAGYLLLRYPPGGHRPDPAVAAAPRPAVSFNYVGQLDAGRTAPLSIVRDTVGPGLAADEERAHLLDVNAAVFGGRLHITWTFSRARHAASTVRELAAAHLGIVEDVARARRE